MLGGLPEPIVYRNLVDFFWFFFGKGVGGDIWGVLIKRLDATERGGSVVKHGKTLFKGAFENPVGVSMCDLLSFWGHLYGFCY